MNRIMVIDDDAGVCWALTEFLKDEGYEVATASSAEEGLEKIPAFQPEVALLDIRLPGMDGLSALSKIRADFPDVYVIMITAHGTMSTAVQAMKRGAFEYLLKPVDMDEARMIIHRALEQRHLSREVQRLRQEVSRVHGEMVGNSTPLQEVFKRIGAAASSDATVLITGETGTGKELTARAIHSHSDRASRAFVPVNCSALPETLLESELFGHIKGAFTGASQDRKGKLEFADGGTLFLDEVTEMSPMMQVKLLRFLEERVIEPVGSNQRVTLNVRVVAASNQNLQVRMADGSFRQDLYYRLNVMEIKLPPLRERIGDLPLLVAHFLETDSGARKTEITREAIEALGTYRWPGNVRELRNAIDHALALSGGHPIRPEHLPENILRPVSAPPANDLQRLLTQFVDGVISKHLDEEAPELYNLTVLDCEKIVIRRALEESNWNQVQAAKLLGLHRNTLRKKIEDFNLAP